MDLATLFVKLKEHEAELKRLDDDDEGYKKKKKKNIILKVTNVRYMELGYEDCQSKRDENMNFMLKKFKEFLRHENKLQNFKGKKMMDMRMK